MMEQSQLIELIKTLTPEERVQVQQFVEIPFFNNGRMRAQVGPLIEHCFKYLRDPEGLHMEKKIAYEALFPRQSYVDGKLEKVMVETQKFIRKVLLTRHYFKEENEFYHELDFAELLRLKGLDTRYRLSIAKLQKMQDEVQTKNATHFHRQFQLETAVHYKECLDNQRKGDLNIPNVLHATETYYYLRRVALLNRYLLQLLLTKLNIPDDIKIQLDENRIPARYLEELPILRINFEIHEVLKKNLPEVSDVRMLFDLLLKHERELDGETLQEFYAYLRNFCAFIIIENRDKQDICYTLHQLYVDNLTRGYLHYEGKLSPSRYLAISENAIRIKEFDWVNTFIEDHKHEIYGENETQDLYRFNKSYYLFAIGEYAKCLDTLPPTSPIVDYFLLGKRLELKALYELQSDLLSYKLDAFKMFLSRTSQKLLSDTQRQIHIDFANFLTQLVSSLPGDQNRADRVIKRIEDNKKTAEWRWLLTKAQALKDKSSAKS